MGLTQKILLFTSLLIVALVAATVGFTTVQADRLAHRAIAQALAETRNVWKTFEADRYNKLKLGVRVLANDPYFKAEVETRDEATVLDSLNERGADLKADFFVATDASGVVIARSDRPGGHGEDLAQDPLVAKALEGEEPSTVWKQGERLFHAVALPMQTRGEIKGVLIAGYGLSEGLAHQIRRLTKSETAFLSPGTAGEPTLAASSLGPREAALRGVLRGSTLGAGNGAPFELDLDGERFVAVQAPLETASGAKVGLLLALRSLSVEMTAFRQFRQSLLVAGIVVMVLALGLAWLSAARITGPVRKLVAVVDRARDGSYTGKVAVESGDEIGVLARAFNNLLTDLHEKEQMIRFLREGMTALSKGADAGSATRGSAPTRALAAAGGSDATPGGLFAGRYQIREVLGRGGMGVVYRATDRQLDEVVALKVLRSEVLVEDPTLVERFKQEIRLARRITHRHVLRTHDFGEADGVPYISMEYLEGVTLKELVARKGALPAGVALRIAKQICQGLEAAHRQGVVHRDIKPQNMLILPESGEVKIMDFGIARVSTVDGASGLTTAGTVLGTPDYMPPEQAQGGTADFRSDLYSLGVVLFEMFTGRLPFPGDTALGVIMSHIQKPAPRPRHLNPALSPEIEALVLRCLEKDPANRYARADDLLSALNAASSRSEEPVA
jgi:serine/threonine-protein kinase